MATTMETGSAGRWGELWGARASDWAAVEDQQAPTYEAVLDRVEITPGARVLDIGCGAGAFLACAARRGAAVGGVDASEALVALARQRLPGADVRVGEMQALPFADTSFDLVTGFNSFFFAADMVAAVREAGRVARPGAPVVLQVWGRPEATELTPMKLALRPFLPPAPSPALHTPGALEAVAREAGLEPREAFDLTWAYEFSDDDDLAAAMLSSALAVLAIRQGGEERVRRAVLEALAPYRGADGGYRLATEWRVLIATA